ncbi:AAA family ATPase [Pseudoalteromonas obscura]|uniref:AAA family ATPase n=1 Tax=Pseudoalteromonas obscura TaxID=3048491 RepID=A0ABT7EE38_9GAMM|nr:AAA family ATPase [Pseudoalteromonas sp. P94(2023)]MDK2593534.1 AAA family ATPase [Pseudoalteromonas sp. P94(2023)]
MQHFIQKLNINNFKSCKEFETELTACTPMVGYNNAGKSNVLEAIEWLLKDKLLSAETYYDPALDIVN